jgi:hypothetical protein
MATSFDILQSIFDSHDTLIWLVHQIIQIATQPHQFLKGKTPPGKRRRYIAQVCPGDWDKPPFSAW